MAGERDGRTRGVEVVSGREERSERARHRAIAGNRLARGIFCAIVGGVCWGLSGNCVSFLFENEGADTLWLMCIRQVLAGALFIAFGLLTDRERMLGLWKDARAMLRVVAFAVCGILFNQFFYLRAIDETNAGTATVLMCLQLVFIMGYSCVRSRRAPRRRELVGLVMALVGTFFIATGGDPSTLSIPPAGLFFGLGSAVGGAMLATIPLKILPTYGTPAVTGSAMLIAGVLLSIFVHPWEQKIAFDASGWLVLAMLVLVGSFLAYLFYMQGVADLGSVRASMLATSEPIAATIISVIWMGVAFMPTDFAGFACIIAMIFLVV